MCRPASPWPIQRPLPAPRRPAPEYHPLRVRYSTAPFAWTSTIRSKRATASQQSTPYRTTVLGGRFIPCAHRLDALPQGSDCPTKTQRVRFVLQLFSVLPTVTG